MIRRPPRSTLSSSSAASDVYKRQLEHLAALPHLLPTYSALPQTSGTIPWHTLPQAVDPVRQDPPMPPDRAARKRLQIEGMWSAARLLLDPSLQDPVIVDFCGGCGNVGLPVASMLGGRGRVIVADVNPRSLQIAAERAALAKLSNVELWEGDIREFGEDFDLGLALHACGEATDVAIERCVGSGSMFIMCPCCVGKLRSDRDHDVHVGCGQQDTEAMMGYPRSTVMTRHLSVRMYDLLATAADFSENFYLAGTHSCLLYTSPSPRDS
eukprot:TRINITY_DN36923_c0_g1_i6.p1 TRINITY_DN36923_c0_g1~~TRINITY_DN36923_c0_g1_i6.p1  ORF type:complete len:268 (-),score=49.04 TRINITY_DN36923_c0_g1_i6:146-949(-)